MLSEDTKTNSENFLKNGEVKEMKDIKDDPSALLSSVDSKNLKIESLKELCSTEMMKTPKKEEKVESKDMAVQTEDCLWLQELIQKVVTVRVKAYQKAAEKSERMDEKLSPVLKRLKEENRDLREKASVLKQKLQAIERYQNSAKKRPSSNPQPVETPPKRICTTTKSPVPINTTPSAQSNIGNINKVPVTSPQPVSFASPVRSVYIPPGPIQHAPQQFYQILPNGQRMLLQSLPTPTNDPGFVMIDPNSNNGHYNIGTQVVVANQGLRMASSHLKDNRVQQIAQVNGKNFPGTLNPLRPPMSRFQTNNVRLPVSWSAPPQQVRPQMMVAQRQPVPIQQPQKVQKPALQSPPTTKTSPPKPPNSSEAHIALPFNPLPKLKASISASGSGIILTWDYEKSGENPDKYKVECYQLFAHQAKGNIRPPGPNESRPWKKIGNVNALPLPMACTLTQFATGNVYYFAVVAVDIHGREGEMSNPCTIRLNLNS